MEEKELLEEARKAFTLSFGATPEEDGLSVLHVWKDEVLFTLSEEIYEAFVANHRSFWHAVTEQVVFLSALAVCVVSVENSALFCAVSILVMALWAYFICKKRKHSDVNEALFLQSGNHLFYDGTRFYVLVKEDGIIVPNYL